MPQSKKRIGRPRPPRVPEPDGTHFALLRMRPTWMRWMRKNPETDEPEFITIRV